MKDITINLNNYNTEPPNIFYKTTVLIINHNLNLLTLMYVFEISDIMFFINVTVLRIPPPVSTLISTYLFQTMEPDLPAKNSSITFLTLIYKQHHFYFNCICRLWNTLYTNNRQLLLSKTIETVFLEILY